MLARSATCARGPGRRPVGRRASAGAAIAPVVRALDEAGFCVGRVELVEPTLDDVFVEKTGRHLEGAAQPADAAAVPAEGAPPDGPMRRYRVVGRLRPGAAQRDAPAAVPRAARPLPVAVPGGQRRRPARTTELPGFPEVRGFLDFQLAAAITQSLLLGGVSTGIATALEIEGGFFDRLVGCPDPAVGDRARAPGRGRRDRSRPGRLLPASSASSSARTSRAASSASSAST